MPRRLVLTLALTLAGCASGTITPAGGEPVAVSPRPAPAPAGGVSEVAVLALQDIERGEGPRLRWSHRPDGPEWTAATLAALRTHGAELPDTVPDGIERWCPAYPAGDRAGREAFWAALVSALAKHESTYREGAVGGGGRWFGLVQIAPATADAYGCRAQSGEALRDGAANAACAVRIMAARSERGAVRRIAGDWGPMHSEAKRADMRAWTREQPYCAL